MGSVLRDTHRTPRSSLKAKMLAIILSSSLAALVAGSALPHPEMPPLQERGECMAWSWSSTTGWKCTQEISTDPVDVNKFRQDSLTAHNVYRAKHGVAALTLSNELNAVAQEWADYLIAQGTFEHRPNNKYGENIYMSSGSAAQDQAQGAVDSWYSEIKDYTFGKEPSWVDLSLGISPRLCGKEARRLESASPRREARLLLLPTIHPLATILASMLTTFLHPSRGALDF